MRNVALSQELEHETLQKIVPVRQKDNYLNRDLDDIERQLLGYTPRELGEDGLQKMWKRQAKDSLLIGSD